MAAATEEQLKRLEYVRRNTVHKNCPKCFGSDSYLDGKLTVSIHAGGCPEAK